MTSIWCYQFDLYSLWRNQKRIGEFMHFIHEMYLLKCIHTNTFHGWNAFIENHFFWTLMNSLKTSTWIRTFIEIQFFIPGVNPLSISDMYIWLEWSKNPKILEFSIIFLSIVYGWWKFFHKIFERNHSIITISSSQRTLKRYYFWRKLFLQFTSRIFQVVYQFMVTFALFHSLRVSYRVSKSL